MIVRDLGIATAYGYAKEKGYTGTEEEFAILMASYATVAEEAAQSASQAATSAQTATTKAGEASASATRAEEAADSINEPDTTLTIAGRAADAKAVGDALASVNVDTVNNARQLLSEKYLLDEEPYLFRASGGDGSDRVEECIVGGSVAWNQLQKYDFTSITKNGVTFTYLNNGTMRVSGTPTERVYQYFRGASANQPLSVGHVILYDVIGTLPSGVTMISSYYNASAQWISGVNISGNPVIVRVPNNAVNMTGLAVDVSASLAGTSIDFTIGGKIHDLTAMFGSTIADYIYSLEQATAGAGVAWFRKYFPDDYYPYSAPTLKHVEGVSAKQVVGFNQWDEDYALGFWSANGIFIVNTDGYISNKTHIPVLPNTAYCFTCKKTNGTSFYLAFYDANKNFISRKTCAYVNSDRMFTTPNNCHYVCFSTFVSYGTTYNHDICISLSDPTKNGTYEPYHKNIYPLDSSLTLRGIPKLTDGKMYFDGDKYNADGTVQRRYGIVDLGTLNWTAGTDSTGQYFQSDSLSSLAKKAPTSYVAANIICAKYATTSSSSVEDGQIAYGSGQNAKLYVRDTSYSDAATFKAVMSGVYLVYELATPTTEEATPYTALQTLDSNGTEEFVSTGIVPVGHYSKYLENLRSKIEGLPKDFSTLIAPTEKAYKATQNYTVGSLLIVDNVLYKVTSAIANGGTITPNTNVTATTLAAVIAAL